MLMQGSSNFEIIRSEFERLQSDKQATFFNESVYCQTNYTLM